MNRKDRVCPASLHRSLDNGLRKLVHRPERILSPFVNEGDTAIDIGCGPGFFTLPMAEFTGETGKTIAADLQREMLDIVARKIGNSPLKERVVLHETGRDSLNIPVKADFILMFYMVHEVPDKVKFFSEIRGMLKDTGKALLIEPPVHVTGRDWIETKAQAEKAGLKVLSGPRLFLDRTAVLVR